MRRLSDSLEATRIMLLQAQKMAGEAQAVLLSLAMEFSGSELQLRQERSEDLTLIPPEELAALLRTRFKSLKLAGGNDATAQLGEANRIIVELRAEVENQRNRADRAEDLVGKLESQLGALEKTLDNERRARQELPNKPVEVSLDSQSQRESDFNGWYKTWQKDNRNWQRDTSVISVLGKTGQSLSTGLEVAAAESTHISQRTARRAIQDCVDAGLLEQMNTASTEGRPPQRYLLSKKGKWLYRMLSGEDPHADEHGELLKAHKSERHLSTILKVGEYFSQLGYEVDREPIRLQVGENRFFQPDLIVKKDGQTFYLEVEIGEKDKGSLNQKWENALAAGGRICVVTDNLATLRRIQGSIAQWSIFEGRRVTLYITHLGLLKERKPKEDPWYAVKEYARD